MAKHLILGYKGNIGKRHYKLLQEAEEQVYGCDINDEPYWNVDMVWICTPLKEHCKQIIIAIEKGITKIFCEKPLETNLKTIEFLKSFPNHKIFIACNYRFHPAVKILKDNLNKVGKILYCRMHHSHYLPYQKSNWRELDNNIILESGTHFVDLALWLFGEKNNKPIWSCFSDRELGISDLYTLWFEHETGVLTQINLDYLRRDKSWGIEIVGTEGTLELRCNVKNPEAVQLIWYSSTEAKMLFEGIIYSDEMYRNQLNYLLKEDWKSNIDEAVEVMNICNS